LALGPIGLVAIILLNMLPLLGRDRRTLMDHLAGTRLLRGEPPYPTANRPDAGAHEATTYRA
ncbi:MAG TPA: hypothetical protein VNO21_01200, partial [Polyangiaceae bacterium]|nr:hypothetical protein [Polyangiaceae bacterium]